MKKRIMRGLVQSVILLVGITFLSFLLSWLSPGDAAERMLKKSGMMVTEEQLEAKREELGLNKPLLIQYKDWMINLCKGDLGTSYKSKKEVAAELAKNLPYTVALTAVSMLLVVLISAAHRHFMCKVQEWHFSIISGGGSPICFLPFPLSLLPLF